MRKSLLNTAAVLSLLLTQITNAGAQSFRVALVGDPQVDNDTELDYARRSIYSELMGRDDVSFAIVLGDLVNEKPGLIAPSEAILDSLPFTWVRLQGNHDGPVAVPDFEFKANGIRFILMNNNIKGFSGGFSAEQKIWLASVLDSADKNEKVVFCTHVPLSDCSDSEEILSLFSKVDDALIVNAHTHTVCRHIINGRYEELTAGATCGTWWRGVGDEFGIPYALMNCGAPRGYFLADFDASKEQWYELSYKVVSRDPELQASATLRDGALTVNVFGGSKEGTMIVRQGMRRTVIPRADIIAPEVQALIDWNNSLDKDYKKKHKSEVIPMLKRNSPHVWSAEAPEWIRPDKDLKIKYADSAMKFRSKVSVGR